MLVEEEAGTKEAWPDDNLTHSHVLTKGVAKENHYGNIPPFFSLSLSPSVSSPSQLISSPIIINFHPMYIGLRLAELSLFPPSVVARAKEMVKAMDVKEALRQQPSLETRKSRLVRGLATTLVQVARNSQLDLPALR